MATTKWVSDPAHSEVSFKVKHLMVTNVSGNFNSFSVTAETADDNDFTNAVIEFSADTASINTKNEQRDEHLRSADFFDAINFPQITFKAAKLEKKDSDGDYELTGDLTIRGVTKSIKVNAEFGGIAKDPWGNIKAGFTVTGKFNRKDFGLTWNAALETGGVMVSDEVRISCEIQLTKQA